MEKYSLDTLLRIKLRDKSYAEQALKQATHNHALEETKLLNIRNKIIDNKNSRSQLADCFFAKIRSSTHSGPDIVSLINFAQKNISQGEDLKQDLKSQIQAVRHAKNKRKLATEDLVTSEIALKVIDKHHASWQQKIRRAEELSTQYESDDQNSTRFCIRKKASS